MKTQAQQEARDSLQLLLAFSLRPRTVALQAFAAAALPAYATICSDFRRPG